MYLKEFVAEVINEIQDGVLEAINRHADRKALGRINPIFPSNDGVLDWKGAVQNVEFDIAVTVSQKEAGEGGGGLKIYVLDLSGKASHSHENSITNRIKFSIPLSLPAQVVSSGPDLPRVP